jgi:hypothetical protein
MPIKKPKVSVNKIKKRKPKKKIVPGGKTPKTVPKY